MGQSIWKWALVLTAMFVVGPLAATAVGAVQSPGGSESGTMLVSASPPQAIALTLLAGAMAIGVGMLASWRCSLRTGLFAAGLALAWAAWSGARVDDVIRESQSVNSMWRLAIEGAILGVLSVVGAFLIARVARPKPSAPTPTSGPERRVPALGLVVGILVGAGAAWAVARSPVAGQALAAGTAAALVATVVGRVVDARTPTWSYVSVIGVLAIAGPASAGVLQGSGIVEAVYGGQLLPLARLAPLDWIAGAFLGVPMGSAWAASMVEKPVSGAS